MDMSTIFKKIKNKYINAKEDRVNRGYSKKSDESKFTNEYQKIEEINAFYVTNYNNSELKIKLMELESIESKIEEPKDRAFKFTMVSIMITLTFNILNYTAANDSQEKAFRKNQISQDENLINTYYMKKLEVENDIKFTKNSDEKEKLEDYHESILAEIFELQDNISSNKNQSQNNEIRNVSMNSILIVLMGFSVIISFMIIIFEEVIWIFRKRKKMDLKIRIEVIRNLID